MSPTNAPAPRGPKAATIIGRYDESVAELQEIVDKTSPSPANAGRRILLSMLDSMKDEANPADTVNATFNYTPGVTGQKHLNATLTVTPAPPAEE